MKLVPGDLVAVVAPSGPVGAAALRDGVAVLESWGLRVRVAPHATAATGYLAGPDAERAADFTATWCDPAVAGVLCARGGYGAQRMVDLVDWVRVEAAGPKVFLGSSDITALHQAVARRLDQITYFGPMVAGQALRSDAATVEALHRALFASQAGQTEPDGQTGQAGADGQTGQAGADGPTGAAGGCGLWAPMGEALVPGSAEGVLRGGTLTLLATALGSMDGVPPSGDRVVFLEDITEAPYRLDRYLTQLLRARWFDGVTGIVLGSFIECGDEAELRAMLIDRLGPLGVPMLWGFPAGHGPTQLTLPLGARVRLDADAGVLHL